MSPCKSINGKAEDLAGDSPPGVDPAVEIRCSLPIPGCLSINRDGGLATKTFSSTVVVSRGPKQSRFGLKSTNFDSISRNYYYFFSLLDPPRDSAAGEAEQTTALSLFWDFSFFKCRFRRLFIPNHKKRGGEAS